MHRYERDKKDGNPCLLDLDIAMDSKDTDENLTTSIIK